MESIITDKTDRVCRVCGCRVKRETVLDYPYYCPNCDENRYRFETDPAEGDDRSKRVYVVVASGDAFNSEVKVAYTEDEANQMVSDLIHDLKMDRDDIHETGSIVRSYSEKANCVVEVGVHEREIDLSR